MPRQIIVVENEADWSFPDADYPVVSVSDYLELQDYQKQRDLRVINLCRSYRYMSTGYYCSLMAEARGHRAVPSVKTMLDLSSRSLYRFDVGGLDELVQKSIGRRVRADAEPEHPRVIFNIFLGKTSRAHLGGLARQIFLSFSCPLLRVALERQGGWRIASIRPLFLHRLTVSQRDLFLQSLDTYTKKRWRPPRLRTAYRYDLAILHDPDDPLAPSDDRALKRFVTAGRNLGIDVELIGQRDLPRLAEYDALFIRATTAIDHFTYRFAKRAQSEGMVVIDDPESILRCTNKVYLAELLLTNRVPTPRTRILRRGSATGITGEFDFPIVLKIPDGAFSRGVVKAENQEEFEHHAATLFRESELILAQEYMYTEFDWRIGVLNRDVIYACQYFMSKKHWQIYKHDGDGRINSGAFRVWHVAEVPPHVVAVALKAASLIGDGLYGVDIKICRGKPYVIEVNDNPSLEAGVEDALLKGDLYRLIMNEFVRRMDLRRR